MNIEIIYASTTEQCKLNQEVIKDCTIQKAIDDSGILLKFPEIDLKNNKQSVGIFGHKATLSTQLKPGDRIEICRPLTIDPMNKRRLVAKKQDSVKPRVRQK